MPPSNLFERLGCGLALLSFLLGCAHAVPKPAFVSSPADAPLDAQLAASTVMDVLESGPDTLLLVAGPPAEAPRDGSAGRVGLGVLRVRAGRVEARVFLGEFLLPLRPGVAALERREDPRPGRGRRGVREDDDDAGDPPAVSQPGSPLRAIVSGLLDPTAPEQGSLIIFSLAPVELNVVTRRVAYDQGPMAWYPRVRGDELRFTINVAAEPRECRVPVDGLAGPPPLERCRKTGPTTSRQAWIEARQLRSHGLFPGDPVRLVRGLVQDTPVDPCGFGVKQALAKDDGLAAAEVLTRPECKERATPEALAQVAAVVSVRLDGCDATEPFTRDFRATTSEWLRSRKTPAGAHFTQLARTHAAGDGASCGRRALTLISLGRLADADALLTSGRATGVTPIELEAAADGCLQKRCAAELRDVASRHGLVGIAAELERAPDPAIAALRSRARRLRPRYPHAAAVSQLLARRLGDTLPALRHAEEAERFTPPPPQPTGNTMAFTGTAPQRCGPEVRTWIETHPRPSGPYRGFEVLSLWCGATEGEDVVQRTERTVEREVVGNVRCDDTRAATTDGLAGCRGLVNKKFVEEDVQVVKGRGIAVVRGTARFVDQDRATRTIDFETTPTSFASGFFGTDVARELERKQEWDRKTADAHLDVDLRHATSDDGREDVLARELLRGNPSSLVRAKLLERYGQPSTWRAWPWTDGG